MDARRNRRMMREQERLLEREQAAICELERKAREADPTYLLPDNLMARVAIIADFLLKVPASRDRNQKILDEADAAVPIELIEAQFRAELVKAAAEWTEDEWAELDKLRNKRFPGRWVPAEQERAA